MLLSNIISAKKAIIFYMSLFTWFLFNSSSRKKEVTSRDHSMAKFAQIFKTYGFELPYYLLANKTQTAKFKFNEIDFSTFVLLE